VSQPVIAKPKAATPKAATAQAATPQAATEVASETPAEPVLPDTLSCPKCDRAVPEASASCPGCGLTREKFLDYDKTGPTAEPELTSAWERVEAAWQKDAAHEDFAAEVALSGNYRLGALWYRQAVSDPQRASKAQQMLDRMQSMATAALMSSKPKIEEEKQPYKNVIILLMVLLFIGAGVGIVLMKKGSPQPTAPLEPSFQPTGRR
tara:strand:- start:5456 stop:6076 length:621 start_codon:yes stop_codon:yes gene_type:complete